MLFLFFVSCQTASGFLLDDQCAIQPHCSYKGDTVDCNLSFRRLTHIPAFNVRRDYFSKISIELNYNQITVIPSHAFRNLTADNVTGVELYFSHNRINQIDAGAFYGIEDEVTLLVLASNNLSYVPKALANLHGLTLLDLSHNPLIKLDPMVMLKLGGSLKNFELSIGNLATFPHELQHLKDLSILT